MAIKKSSESSKPQVSHAEIQARAQKIYEDRVKKNQPGSAESDWLAAEKELSPHKR